jgi:hypothetical protein
MYYAKQGVDDARAAVNLWHMMFEDDDAQLVSAAVKAFIASDTKGFPPAIGQIKAKLDMIMREAYGGGELTPMEAWAKVQKAIRNSAYNSDAEFAKLPDTIRAVLGGASALRDYALMDSETINSVVASNFQRSFTARRDHVVEMRMLPADVKAFISTEQFKALGAWNGEKNALPSREQAKLAIVDFDE